MHTTSTLDHSLSFGQSRSVSTTIWIAAFALLTFAGANIVIPTQPVPMTLQTAFVLLGGVLLGARKGALAQLAYLAVGALGAPVFAYGGGITYFASHTAGYLLAFPLGAFVAGALAHSRVFGSQRGRALGIATAIVAGQATILVIGTAWLKWYTGNAWPTALYDGFAVLQLWDALKLAGTAALAIGVLRACSPRSDEA